MMLNEEKLRVAIRQYVKQLIKEADEEVEVEEKKSNSEYVKVTNAKRNTNNICTDKAFEEGLCCCCDCLDLGEMSVVFSASSKTSSSGRTFW